MRRTYPLDTNLQHHLFLALTLGIWVYLFLSFTEPFDINKFDTNEKNLLPIYGFLASFSYSLPLLYQHLFIKKNESWLIINEFVFIFILVVIGSILNFSFYKLYIVFDEPDTYNYFDYTFRIYFPALAIILPFLVIARFLLATFFQKTTKKITIKGQGQLDFINLKFQDLLFIQSSDNYIDINFIEGSIVKKKTMRGKISEVENKYKNLLKTHRSFLVNPEQVKQLKTQNNKLYLDVGFDILVPVSRSLQQQVKEQLQLATNS